MLFVKPNFLTNLSKIPWYFCFVDTERIDYWSMALLSKNEDISELGFT